MRRPMLARRWLTRASAVGSASESPRDVARLAKKAAERALVLDPTSAEAHLALGLIRYQFDWDWAGAERSFKQGIAANPSGTAGRIDYANFLTAMGRFDESVEVGRQTLVIDPLSPAAHNELAFPLSQLGRDDEALEVVRERGWSSTRAFHQTPLCAQRSLRGAERPTLTKGLAHLARPRSLSAGRRRQLPWAVFGRCSTDSPVRQAEARAASLPIDWNARERVFVPAERHRRYLPGPRGARRGAGLVGGRRMRSATLR